MCFILNIETATTVCSVSVSSKDQVITYQEVNGGYTHAENLHVFIKEVIAQAGLQFNQLGAVSVSKGPGSYTGLRIGVSAAKGLAYALNIPLIALDTMKIMTKSATNKAGVNGLYCPMLDARRMEVYCALYDAQLETILPVTALIVDEASVQQFSKGQQIFFFGDGMQKCKTLLESIPSAEFIQDVIPSSENMAELSFKAYEEKRFEDVAYFEPYYLKEFLITSKKK
ncbi:MAG: tRNA (adenosine(37)-N6)-threonylcarbamoyltransferase complex dimerization subunit type 1 TsaB [Bacteroidetes bacterium]|nr:tRNA (adenosine(37)-N6)-threonylcarbamoyltransferase complex dimerization subunit type 1 TsaB [Bacteroidota bacterium]